MHQYIKTLIVVLCIGYHLYVSSLPVDDLENRCALFLKFHKVASGSVSKVLTSKLGNEWWKMNSYCGRSSYAHSILHIYRNVNSTREIYRDCVRKEKINCTGLTVTTLLRDPIERVVSQFYSFPVDVEKAIPEMNTSVIKLFEAPRNITSDEMMSMLKNAQLHFNNKIKNDIWQNLNLYEYLYTFGKIKKDGKKSVNYIESVEKNEQALSVSLETIRNEIYPIGLMENLPSYYVLLSKIFDVNLELSCHIHNEHGLKNKYLKYFNSTSRPPVHELFTKEVVTVINDFTKYERRIWEEAKIIHTEHLKFFNLTVETATEYWLSTCKRRLNYFGA